MSRGSVWPVIRWRQAHFHENAEVQRFGLAEPHDMLGMVPPVISGIGVGKDGESGARGGGPGCEVPEPVCCYGELAGTARMRADRPFMKVADRRAESGASLLGKRLRLHQLVRVEIDVRVKRMCASHADNLGTKVLYTRAGAMDDNDDIAAHKALYETYIDAWNRVDLNTYCSLFAFPVVVGGGGRAPDMVPDLASWRARTKGNLDALAARGWSTSTIDALHVGVMAADTGIITVVYSRFDADGARIEGGTSNYLTRKLDGTWKMVGLLVP